jgi:hypothetical protein
MNAGAFARLANSVIARDAVRFLDPAEQFVALAFDLAQGIIGRPAPLLLDLAVHLLPLALQSIPIHRWVPLVEKHWPMLGATLATTRATAMPMEFLPAKQGVFQQSIKLGRNRL